jgi:hypothetical protein
VKSCFLELLSRTHLNVTWVYKGVCEMAVEGLWRVCGESVESLWKIAAQ